MSCMAEKARRWYVYNGNKQYGPYSEADLHRYIDDGRVRKDALVWRGGMEGWKKIVEVESLKPRFVKPSEVPRVREIERPAPETKPPGEPLPSKPISGGDGKKKKIALILCLIAVVGAAIFVLVTMGPEEWVLQPLQAENTDSDNDGWWDYREWAFGTDPNRADTDGDNISDNEDPNLEVSLEIVESAPGGGDLDNENIRNTLDVWEELLSHATKTIDIETFYMYQTSTLDPMYSAIKNATARGVKVRIIIDQSIYDEGGWRSEVPDELDSIPNIEVRTLDLSDLVSGEYTYAYMHAKYFIIDRKVAFVGSQNWSNCSATECREVGVVVRSRSVCETLTEIFEKDWVQSGGEIKEWKVAGDSDGDGWPDTWETQLGTDPSETDTDGDGVIDPEDSNPFIPAGSPNPNASVRWLYPTETCPAALDNPEIADTEPTLLNLINSAENTIHLEVFIYRTHHDYYTLDNALRGAAARGVDIRMLIDDKYYEGSPAAIDSLAALDNVAIKIIDIEAIGSMGDRGWVHAKFLIVDGENAWIGSGNWQKFHMHAHRNVSVAFNSPEVASILDSIFVTDWGSNYTITL